MIVPMLKYHIVVHGTDRENCIRELMGLGVLHIDAPENKDIKAIKDKEIEIQNIERTAKKVERRLAVIKKKTTQSADAKNLTEEDILALDKELSDLQIEQNRLEDQIELLKPWGEIPLSKIKDLEEQVGLRLNFYKISKARLNRIKQIESLPIHIVNRDKEFVYLIGLDEELDQMLPVIKLSLPNIQLSQLIQELSNCTDSIRKLEEKLDNVVLDYASMAPTRLIQAENDCSYLKAVHQFQGFHEDHLLYLTGYCPNDRSQQLEDYLKRSKFYFEAEVTQNDNKTPVVLQNNKFVRLFEPIGKLFALPKYQEWDLTVLFAPFFLIFFGFCLGDVGYGIIIAGIGIWGRINTKHKPIMSLVTLFGISTIIVGFVSGTFFGLELKKWVAPALGQFMLDQNQLFYTALIIGAVQILVGMIVHAIRMIIQKGWQYGISKIGWVLLLVGLTEYAFLSFFNPMVYTISFTVCLLMIILFGAPGKGWLYSIGFGMADLYNITGVLGDLLSYIRLFALGVSSAILGLVVNSIAIESMQIPYVGYLVGVLILVVGHSANLALAGLSAFVHPLRLTFVEFFKNAGFEGGGKPYEPLEYKESGI